jgi:hypothetical protein
LVELKEKKINKIPNALAASLQVKVKKIDSGPTCSQVNISSNKEN